MGVLNVFRGLLDKVFGKRRNRQETIDRLVERYNSILDVSYIIVVDYKGKEITRIDYSKTNPEGPVVHIILDEDE